jgi:glycine reductase
MAKSVRVVHYLNQFFGGIGGEEKANMPVQAQEGAVGPGRALQQALGAEGTVVATLVGGDNYVVEEQSAALQALGDAISRYKPDVLVAGPAFDAGRYGLACALMCQAAQAQGVPSVAAMHPENTGVLTLGRQLVVVSTGTDVAQMQSILFRIAPLALKLGREEELGPALDEGYLPRGFRRPLTREKTGAERAIDMLEARMADRPFVSEVFRRDFELVDAPPPVPNLASATLALISSGGLVPKGNPDRLESGRTTELAHKYSIAGLEEFTTAGWECIHSGFHPGVVNERDTNYVLPLRSVRQLESKGVIGQVHPYFYSTAGNGMAVKAARRIGEGIVRELKEAKVDSVLLVAT